VQIINGLTSLETGGNELFERGCIATIGVFDGVHIGHFSVINRVVANARDRSLAPTVVTFASHPKEELRGRAPATVTSLEHRLRLFERVGVELVLVLEFNAALRQLSAEQFLRNHLLPQLGVRGLVMGFDSKFGHGRGGTLESLRPLAKELGLELEEVAPLRMGKRAVSSTAVREAVSLGELSRAASMLGRPVAMLGTVIHGDGRGSQLGFPTANLDPHHELQPPDGVYAAFAQIGKLDAENAEQLHPAVVNLGSRPTFGAEESSPEAHLLDFSGDLYGRTMELHFIKHLRATEKFDDVDALTTQLKKDVVEARTIIASAHQTWRIPGRYLPIEGSRLEDFLNS